MRFLRWIPNAISILRFLLIIPYTIGFAIPRNVPFISHNLFWIALFIIVTDMLDGALARKFKAQSAIGTLFDTAADNALLIVSWVGFFVYEYYGTLLFVILLLPKFLVVLFVVFFRAAKKQWQIVHTFGDKLQAVAAYAGLLVALSELAANLNFVFWIMAFFIYTGCVISIAQRYRLYKLTPTKHSFSEVP